MITPQKVLSSTSAILFLNAPSLGLVMLLSSMAWPAMSVTALIAVAACYGAGVLFQMRSEYLEESYFAYCPLLVGLSVGFGRSLDLQLVLFAGLAGVLCWLVTVCLADWLIRQRGLPLLSLPFAVVALAFDSILPAANGGPVPATGVVQGYFEALGCVVFAPQVEAGMVLALALVIHSRILWVLSVLGYAVGLAVHGGVPSPDLFNCMLIAMALGGVFLLPGLKSYARALLLAGIAAALLPVLPGYAWTFNAIGLVALAALRILRDPCLIASPGTTPEASLEQALLAHRRFRRSEIAIHLPFAGGWTVWQGMNGNWTHKGLMRYAYDFVVTDGDGQTHTGTGARLDEFYAFGKPVFSPIDGTVVAVQKHLRDAPVGHPDVDQNWGNYVILQHAEGYWVEISHFACNSIAVVVGQSVEQGQFLGACGNSGYSPQPHIHVQVQAAAVPGAATLPFGFGNVVRDDSFHTALQPREGDRVEPLLPDRFQESALNFVLDEKVAYTVRVAGAEEERLELTVAMDETGTCCLSSDRGKFFFGKRQGAFYAYRLEGEDPWLRYFYLALSKVPLFYRDRLEWQDSVALQHLLSGVHGFVHAACVPFCPECCLVGTNHRFVGRGQIETRIESKLWGVSEKLTASLHPDWGVQRIVCGHVEIEAVPVGSGAATVPAVSAHRTGACAR